MSNGSPANLKRRRAAWAAGIVVTSALGGVMVNWAAPGIDRYAQDRLMRSRGALPAPDDIAIVAIDEPSIVRLGHFPWPRSVMARVIDAVAAAQPRVIALDVLYTDPTSADQDDALARAVARAGNVVVAAELVDSPVAGGPATWLLPLPALQHAAAAVAHVNVLAESEGVGRGLMIVAADDSGRSLRAMAVEAVRIADRTPEQAVTDTPNAVLLGHRTIPVETTTPAVVIGQANAASIQYLRAARMSIDYIGPTGSFSQSTYSIADVLEGRTPAARFRGKYVLIGATAASLGDRLASPYVHAADARADLHGTLMPGVEVLANSVNTILRSRFYSETPGWLAFLIAAAAAALTIALLRAAQGRRAFAKQVAALLGMAALVVIGSYIAFTRYLTYPPITPALVSFASAGLLGLVRRSIVTNMRLDENIATLERAEREFTPYSDAGAAAESIARFTNAEAVAIYGHSDFEFDRAPEYVLLAAYGGRVVKRVRAEQQFQNVFRFKAAERERFHVTSVKLDEGALVLAHSSAHPPSGEDQRLCAAIASASIESNRDECPEKLRLPKWLQGAEEKARSLGRLNRRLTGRSRFVDLAMRSVDDGLVIASADGRIAFANRRAGEILRSSPEMLAGASLLQRLCLIDDEGQKAANGKDPERVALERLLVDRAQIEREITVRVPRPRRFIVRVAAVAARKDGAGPVLGIVASFSDITRHHELQQTKNDVVALVSHEMRTPLTAIQGMSELLASYEMEPERRKEISGAINTETKRLTRMITDYLDIARLESGATVLRVAPLRLETLLERTLLLLDPIASKRGIRLTRRYAEVEPIIADPDLLARAVSNLVSNAVKYSPDGSEVTLSTREDDAGVTIEVADRGYGIAAAHLERIFEKFYRVPRVQDADAPGTGLGLALVREIAELHGGTVRVSSAPGSGSTFVFSIPRSTTDA